MKIFITSLREESILSGLSIIQLILSAIDQTRSWVQTISSAGFSKLNKNLDFFVNFYKISVFIFSIYYNILSFSSTCENKYICIVSGSVLEHRIYSVVRIYTRQLSWNKTSFRRTNGNILWTDGDRILSMS